MKLLRKLGIPAVALAGMLMFFSPSSANARVRFGVQIGVPAYPVYTYPSPYYEPYYVYPYGYTYVGPYATFGWGHHHHRVYRHEYRYYRR